MAEKLQVVPALEHLVRLLRKVLRQGHFEVVGLLLFHRPLIRARLDLGQQHAAAPAALRGGAQVVEPGGGVFHLVDQQEVVSPGNFCDKLLKNWVARIFHVNSPHRPHVLARKPPHVRKLRPQIRRQPFNHRLPPARRALFLDNAPPDVPVQQYQLPVHRPPGLDPGGLDPALHFGKEMGVVI